MKPFGPVDPKHIVLIGLSGSGKTTVGRQLAERLGRPFVDTDALIEAAAGQDVPGIFRERGEPAFRALERQAVAHALAGPPSVIATGGGAPVDPVNRPALWDGNLVVWLDAPVATLAARLGAAGAGRPLLAAGDPAARLTELLAARRHIYEAAHVRIDTGPLTPGQATGTVLRFLQQVAQERFIVETQTEIGDGILAELGRYMRAAGLAGRAFVITERPVGARFGDATLAALAAAGYDPVLTAIDGGEPAKSLAQAGALYGWLADQHAERRDVIVALGGGVIGDLAGFVAATYLRGVALVQVPTTLLAQIDSAIGGKTAVNLPQGKNLVGAFHPARLTLVDIAMLDTLPLRELRAGWAEVIKTAIIFDKVLFEELEHVRPEAMPRDQRLDVIARCIRWKEKVVAEDPKEQGPRIHLNFGHTIGHALEAAAGYGTYLHGEAVAIGMVGAAEISRRRGLIDDTLRERIEAALVRNDLPVRYAATTATPEAILAAASSDKKAQRARLRWVLTRGLGQTVIADDVPMEIVREVVEGLRG